jgi:hypothetical protein
VLIKLNSFACFFSLQTDWSSCSLFISFCMTSCSLCPILSSYSLIHGKSSESIDSFEIMWNPCNRIGNDSRTKSPLITSSNLILIPVDLFGYLWIEYYNNKFFIIIIYCYFKQCLIEINRVSIRTKDGISRFRLSSFGSINIALPFDSEQKS